MVPFRAIAEGLGAEVGWEEATRTVVFIRDGQSHRLPIGTPLLDEVGEYMGTPIIVADRTFVPLRHVSEVFGAVVRWEAATQAVYITE
jgi:hypothetical protein